LRTLQYHRNSISLHTLYVQCFKDVSITVKPPSDFSTLELPMSENRTKNWLKNNCLECIAK